MSNLAKKIVHDLMPLSSAATELSKIISELLCAIEPHTKFDTEKASRRFEECAMASQKMALSCRLIEEYVANIDTADGAA